MSTKKTYIEGGREFQYTDKEYQDLIKLNGNVKNVLKLKEEKPKANTSKKKEG